MTQVGFVETPGSITIREGQILTGPQFNEPMRVETVGAGSNGSLSVGLVGQRSSQFRRVSLSLDDVATLSINDERLTYDGDGQLLRLAVQAHALGIAYEFDPFFGLSVSRVDPLPHQLEAVYDHLLKLPSVRFLLADDAGAGKTIMSGLLLRELKLRGLVERILVVCPANLTFQWQRELKEKFDEQFIVMKGSDIREQFGVNQWMEHRHVITSLDLAKREDVLNGLRQTSWDLVIVDEAHRMSARDETHKSLRYKLGELLRDSANNILLLTATPHKGDAGNFTLFLQLLDRDAYADVQSIREAMEQRRAPFYLRRTKEAMVYFPERQPDGTWSARKVFTKRHTNTPTFSIEDEEFALYSDISRFVKRQSTHAAASGDDRRANAVGFLMSMYQRRQASSAYAIRRSLENRADRLDRQLQEARELARSVPDVPDADDLEEMDDVDLEKAERIAEAVSLTANPADIQQEIAELRDLASRAWAIESAGQEAKLVQLRRTLHEQGFFANHQQRLLIFTEFKDTLDHLVARLKEWGLTVGTIHGGMKAGSRDEPGTRLFAEQQFRDGAVQVLVATEAAGEGINLQCCNILFNYDIPWNPNRLEQRMGRIHRYGQLLDCLIFNFVAGNTIEGRVLQGLLKKLDEIRDALDDDAVFNVVGEVLPAAQIDRVFRDYYAGRIGDAALEDRILRDVDEGHFREICQNALEGLATRNINMEMLVERRALAQERRLVPESIARFMLEAANGAGLELAPLRNIRHAFSVGRTPPALKAHERDSDWRLPEVSVRYTRITTDKEMSEVRHLEWVTPGHPLFEALRRHSLDAGRGAFSSGACFYSVEHDSPSRLDFYRARVVDGLGEVVKEGLFVVETDAEGARASRTPDVLGNLTPASPPADLPQVATADEPVDWLNEHVLATFLADAHAERAAEVDRIARHVDLALAEVMFRADQEIGRASDDMKKQAPGAEGRYAQADARHAEASARRERRNTELKRQRHLTLQGVERITSVLVLPHPSAQDPEVVRHRPSTETEQIAMRVVMEHERQQGKQVRDVSADNVGYDVTSLDPSSGELRLIEVKGLAAAAGTIILTPNERRVAEDRRDCYWLYIVTNCADAPQLQEPIEDPARFPWHEVTQVQHYWLEVNAMTRPMEVREARAEYNADGSHGSSGVLR